MRVRQSFFFGWMLVQAAIQAPAQAPFPIQKATGELERLKELAQIGAISRTRLAQAEDNLADARDEDSLGRLLYGSIGVEQLTETQASELIAAAQRRVDRIVKRYAGQAGLVDQGVLPRSQMEEFERQLSDHRLTLQLAESRARIFEDLLNMAKAEEIFEAGHAEDDSPKPMIESFTGSGAFKEAHLKYVEAAFEKQFKKPFPVSARGQSALHTMLGFDHSGRVDIGVNPDDEEGQWLRSQLQLLRVPYIALRAMIPGKSTAPHVHIGLPSNRLKSADTASGGGLN